MDLTQFDLFITLRLPDIQGMAGLTRLLQWGYAMVMPGPADWLYKISLDQTDPRNNCVVIVPHEKSLVVGQYPWQGNFFLRSPHVVLSSEDSEMRIDHIDLQFTYGSRTFFVDGVKLSFTIESSLHGVHTKKPSLRDGVLSVGRNRTIVFEIIFPNLEHVEPKLKIVVQLIFDIDDPEFYVVADFKGSMSMENWPQSICYLLKVLFDDTRIKSWKQYCAQENFEFREVGFIRNEKFQFLINFFLSLQDFVREKAYLLRDTMRSVADDFLSLGKPAVSAYIVPYSDGLMYGLRLY